MIHWGSLRLNVNGCFSGRVFLGSRLFVFGLGFRKSRYFSSRDDTVTTIVTYNVQYFRGKSCPEQDREDLQMRLAVIGMMLATRKSAGFMVRVNQLAEFVLGKPENAISYVYRPTARSRILFRTIPEPLATPAL
jgi:hypothetical protein